MTWMTDCWQTDPPSDPNVVYQWSGLQVLAQRQEVMFRDGSAVHLHPVLVAGQRDMFLRALQCESRWLATDLRAHGPELEDDVLRLQPRDTPGVVFFTLRSSYACALDFLSAVARLAASPRSSSPISSTAAATRHNSPPKPCTSEL
jgi:hypothetical protein